MRIDVQCAPAGDGHRCEVDVVDRASTSRHIVLVSHTDFERWRHGRSAEQLVRDSFGFLLEREPKQSILKEFDLSIIPRYFSDFDDAIRPR